MTALLPFRHLVSRQFVYQTGQPSTRLATLSSVLRASQLCTTSNQGSACGLPSVCAQLKPFTSRRYATTAASESASKPKAGKGRPRAKRTKTTTTAAQSGSEGDGESGATTKKTGGRRKATSAKKTKKTTKKTAKKVAKKPVQRRGRPVSKTRQDARNRKVLKEKALFSEPKTLPSTAWQLFFTEQRPQGGTLSENASQTTELAARYKALPSAEMERLNHRSNANQKANAAAYNEWVSQFTPLQVKEANRARKQLVKDKQAAGKKHKKAIIIKDERVVKNPRNAYTYFAESRWESGDFKHMRIPEASKLIGREWKEISAVEKKEFEDKSAADTARYIEEHRTVYGEDPPSQKGRVKRAAKAAAAA